jgi:hypothetical protein
MDELMADPRTAPHSPKAQKVLGTTNSATSCSILKLQPQDKSKVRNTENKKSSKKPKLERKNPVG